MIKRIEIRNFQAHKKVAIDFDEGVTTIVGPSDIGKSAIIRAIRWVVFNKPGGEAFIHEGASRCSVKLFLSTGETIYREKGKENLYKINDKELKAFKMEAPEEVQSLLNLSDINFQQQHDAPYWFSQTAGEVSRQLNRIIDLEIIDHTISNIGTSIRKAKTTIDVLEQQQEDIKKDLEKVEDADEINTSLRRAEGAYAQCEVTSAKAVSMRNMIQGVNRAEGTLKSAVGAARSASRAAGYGLQWAEMARKREQLAGGIGEVTRLAKITRTAPPQSELNKLEILAAVYRDSMRITTMAIDLIMGFEMMEKKVCQANQRVGAVEQELKKLTKGKCPLCGQKVES